MARSNSHEIVRRPSFRARCGQQRATIGGLCIRWSAAPNGRRVLGAHIPAPSRSMSRRS